MKADGKIILVTGGANGIGRAMCERFAAEKAGQIFVADVDFAGAQTVANQIGGTALRLDVSDEQAVQKAVGEILRDCGYIDLVC
jgi:NAD(P)-dependent dehydrogenase (short-subunit alcohol dehydrogenase family)